MFWKKSQTKNVTPKKLFVSPEERREYYRVGPAADEPIKLNMDNKIVPIIDISSGGLCCANNNFKTGSLYSFHLYLPDITRKIFGKLKILKITEEILCHCQFNNLDPELENLIQRYTLNRQKEELEYINKRRNLKR